MKKIIIVLLVIGAGIGIYYFQVIDKDTETAAEKSIDYKVNVIDMLSEFEQDTESANTKYNNKTIEISGIVSEIEMNGENIDVLFESDESMSTINVQLIPDMKKNSSIESGKAATVKGIYVGFNEELGIDIELNQGVILN